MAPTPGLLYVTMQPTPSLPPSAFHDWYNNEHGPNRLRLPFCKNGFRYRALDLPAGAETGTKELPEWMACYDMTDTAELLSKTYLTLREPSVKTQREKDVMAKIAVDRKTFDLDTKKVGSKWVELEDPAISQTVENVLVAVTTTVEMSNLEAFKKWHSESHIPALSSLAGWRRTRRYVRSKIEHPGDASEIEVLTLHDFDPSNGLGGPEHKSIQESAKSDLTSLTKKIVMRKYALSYIFGPCPRYLAPSLSSWTSTDGLTHTHTSPPAISSYITTPDGITLPYRLQGSQNPTAPLIICVNSILTTHGIWDAFVASFLSSAENSKNYRILRYNARGRTSLPSSSTASANQVTVALLASDVIAILDALKVAKAAALIGVSLGGATVLRTALSYPDRVEKFIACDTNAFAPPSNPKAWGERIEMCEAEGAVSSSSESDEEEPIVGENLAEATTRRWFVPESYDGGDMEKETQRVKEMVRSNSLAGFKTGVQALYAYDFRDEMAGGQVPGAFVVGGGDGVLPKSMEGMARSYGKGGGVFRVVEGAGHLPMVEKPGEFAGVVGEFLEG
ncbi:alpha/beta-hydrolase [Aulographum hederae CBS 113979]|uniref:Alpha/beta-hydrolase n=1 Tax=Aulographum hederae CBS 113979 TaxID=1176131 RepID=A0A6G1GT88_9PEZI|nr:alpha/beta-hydrolase [Aulographum hederae CBS 113979]